MRIRERLTGQFDNTVTGGTRHLGPGISGPSWDWWSTLRGKSGETDGACSPSRRKRMRSKSFAIRSIACLAVIVTGYLGTTRIAAETQIRRGPVPVDCNRACLEGLVDQYL